MSFNKIFADINEFLKSLKLSSYEIRAYLTLIKADLTAKALSSEADVPTGRIYEVLDMLKEKGLIEIQESRPKLYRAYPPNIVFQNMINQIKAENQKQINELYAQAKILEKKLTKTKWLKPQDEPSIFWQTAFGAEAVMSLYIKRLEVVKEEFLMTGFLTEDTLRIIHLGRGLFGSILDALQRGVKVKILWSFEFDERPLSDELKETSSALYYKLLAKLEQHHGITPEIKGLKVKFVYKKLPTYYDIFDKNRVIIKLQNPLKPSQIFACLDVLDPNLTNNLREKYLSLWLHDGVAHDGSL